MAYEGMKSEESNMAVEASEMDTVDYFEVLEVLGIDVEDAVVVVVVVAVVVEVVVVLHRRQLLQSHKGRRIYVQQPPVMKISVAV
jgi:hypothetical protein